MGQASSPSFEVQELEVTITEQQHRIPLGEGTIFQGKAQKQQDYDLGVLINSCDRGYGIFNFDDHTVRFLEKSLSGIHNYFNGISKPAFIT